MNHRLKEVLATVAFVVLSAGLTAWVIVSFLSYETVEADWEVRYFAAQAEAQQHRAEQEALRREMGALLEAVKNAEDDCAVKP